MDDTSIVDLFWARDDKAIVESQGRYGNILHSLSYSVLHSDEDADECVNDALLRAWNSIPPTRPKSLRAYLAKIVRNISLDRLREDKAQKRCSQCEIAFDEVEEIIPGDGGLGDGHGTDELASLISAFLRTLPSDKRTVFLARYWNLLSVSDIAKKYGYSESGVKTTLYRMRIKLKDYLEKEGYMV